MPVRGKGKGSAADVAEDRATMSVETVRAIVSAMEMAGVVNFVKIVTD